MDAIFAPFTPMFEPFPSTYRIHANVPAQKQARSTAHPHELPSETPVNTGVFVWAIVVEGSGCQLDANESFPSGDVCFSSELKTVNELTPTGEELDNGSCEEPNVSCFGEARRCFEGSEQQLEFHRELHTRLGHADGFLTPREAQIVRYTLVDQLDDAEIALKMGIRKSTVIQQRSRAHKKLEQGFSPTKTEVAA